MATWAGIAGGSKGNRLCSNRKHGRSKVRGADAAVLEHQPRQEVQGVVVRRVAPFVVGITCIVEPAVRDVLQREPLLSQGKKSIFPNIPLLPRRAARVPAHCYESVSPGRRRIRDGQADRTRRLIRSVDPGSRTQPPLHKGGTLPEVTWCLSSSVIGY